MASYHPTDDPVGTIRVNRASGMWAVRFATGTPSGKGAHVWLSPAGVIAKTARVLHHVEVADWEVGEARRWTTEGEPTHPDTLLLGLAADEFETMPDLPRAGGENGGS